MIQKIKKQPRQYLFTLEYCIPKGYDDGYLRPGTDDMPDDLRRLTMSYAAIHGIMNQMFFPGGNHTYFNG